MTSSDDEFEGEVVRSAWLMRGHHEVLMSTRRARVVCAPRVVTSFVTTEVQLRVSTTRRHNVAQDTFVEVEVEVDGWRVLAAG